MEIVGKVSFDFHFFALLRGEILRVTLFFSQKGLELRDGATPQTLCVVSPERKQPLVSLLCIFCAVYSCRGRY